MPRPARSSSSEGTLLDEPRSRRSRRPTCRSVKIRSPLICETKQGRVRQLLRARSRPRHAGQHGRGGRRDRGAVDRRAGHPAHHAHLPHRRRGADQRAVVHRVELRRQDRDQDRDMPTIIEHRRRLVAMVAAGGSRSIDTDGRERRSTASRTARVCASRRRRTSSAASASPSGIRTPADHHRGRRPTSTSRTWSTAGRCRKRSTRSTGIAKRVVIDWRTASSSRTICVRPIVIKGKDGKILKLARGGDARYLLAVDAISRSIRAAGEGGRRASRVSRPKAPRRATSPAVCRGWRSCSRRASRRRRRSSPKSSGTVQLRQGLQEQAPAHASSRPRRTWSRRSI